MFARQKNYAYNSKYADEMYPAYFVYPENGELESIVSAIEFGRRSGLHVMGRSGGHQYCGLSSDSGSVIIDMQEWDDIGEIVRFQGYSRIETCTEVSKDDNGGCRGIPW